MKKAWPVLLSLAIGVVSLSGCEYIATRTAPEKSASASRLPSAEKADALFWEVFHGGAYARIDQPLSALTAAYLENPSDATTAAHIGFLHIWRLSERSRLDTVPPSISDHSTLARRYFQEAVALSPDDARFLGFLGSATLAEASIHQNEKATREGYYQLRDGIKAWPEFNLFTAGYVLSRMPADSPRFAEGMEWQWETLERCTGEKIDRERPSYRKYMALETTSGSKRACWNSWIAPHNFEGFFLNMGDMLVKSGRWQTAQEIYANARLSRTYAAWPYRSELESRIANAKDNVARFRQVDQVRVAGQQIMINSRHACMACHQK